MSKTKAVHMRSILSRTQKALDRSRVELEFNERVGKDTKHLKANINKLEKEVDEAEKMITEIENEESDAK